MLLAALSVSIYSIFAKPYIMKYGGLYFTSIIIGVGVCSLIMVSYLVGQSLQFPSFSIMDWWIVLFLGVVGAAMQFASFMWALGCFSLQQPGLL